MKGILSRFGGHGMIITEEGTSKSSFKDLPEDKSYTNMINNYSIQMNGFKYLSSYRNLPPFMGAFDKLPKGCIKIGELEHPLTDISLPFDSNVLSSIYIQTNESKNIFLLYIKTTFESIEYAIGKIEPSYDLILIFQIENNNHTDENEFIESVIKNMICVLIFEMEIHDCVDEIKFTSAKTHLGKKINSEILNSLIQKLKNIEDETQLKDLLNF